MGGFGLLPGLGVGILLAVGLFIVQYSRVPVVRNAYSGRLYHSRVVRSHPQAELLRQEGQALLILELQGYVFFGTANRVYEEIKERLASAQTIPLQVVLLDFRRVIGIDASAALSFMRLKRLLRQHKMRLIFTHLRPEVEQVLQREVLTPGDRDMLSVFADLDHGVEWFEAQTLAGETARQATVEPLPGAVQEGQIRAGLALLFATLGSEVGGLEESADRSLLHLMSYLERVELEAGQVLISQGEPHQFMYFLDAGELTIEYRTEDGKTMRLETNGPGAVVGELGLYLGTPASASVTAAQPATVYGLSLASLHRLEQEEPLAAALLHRFLLKRVGLRLRGALETIDALSQ
jgi:SulP family sulfate permease